MAPEVAKNEKYGFPSDVYSFSILLWELVTLEKPFESIKSLPQFNEEVVRRHDRPPLKSVPSPVLKTLLAECWDKDQEKRPSFSEVCQVLHEHVSKTNAKPIFRRCRSTVSWRASSEETEGETTPETQCSGSRHDFSGNQTQATASNGSGLTSSRIIHASDADTETKSQRCILFFPWLRKRSESPDAPNSVVDRSYQKRTWVQRNLLRKATMRLDLSTRSFRMQKYDLGNPGSFRSSSGSIQGTGHVGRRPSQNSSGSFTSRRRSSGKSDSNIEAMAAVLAAEAKSNRKILRELKREKDEKCK